MMYAVNMAIHDADPKGLTCPPGMIRPGEITSIRFA